MTLNNEELNPAYMINDYVWALLQKELNWTKIGTLNPITPVDGPEFKNGSKSYIVYGFSELPNNHPDPIHTANLTYVVFGSSAGNVNTTLQLLSMAFSRQDAVSNVVSYAKNTSRTSRPFEKMGLDYIDVTGLQSAMPPMDEGGWYDGNITISYMYKTTDKDFSISVTP